jgi:DNA-directed RNA polymerase specialized sigma24 family protein
MMPQTEMTQEFLAYIDRVIYQETRLRFISMRDDLRQELLLAIMANKSEYALTKKNIRWCVSRAKARLGMFRPTDSVTGESTSSLRSEAFWNYNVSVDTDIHTENDDPLMHSFIQNYSQPVSDRATAVETLNEMANGLTPKKRAIFEMMRDGATCDEVGEALGVTASRAQQCMRAIIQVLKRSVKCDEHTAQHRLNAGVRKRREQETVAIAVDDHPCVEEAGRISADAYRPARPAGVWGVEPESGHPYRRNQENVRAKVNPHRPRLRLVGRSRSDQLRSLGLCGAA